MWLEDVGFLEKVASWWFFLFVSRESKPRLKRLKPCFWKWNKEQFGRVDLN
jgi:hypothetical protein